MAVAVLAVRILLAPCFVVVASLIGRRFGLRLGGLVAGLPVIAGPILLVLALDHGTRFASRAAVGTLLGLVALAAFVVAYVGAAVRVAWPGALAAGWGAFAVVLVAMRPVSVGPLAGLAIACGALALTLVVLPRPAPATGSPPPHPRWDLPLRALATAVMVVAVTAAAGALGAQLSGLVAAFPIITPVLSTFTHAQRGHQEALRLLRGFTLGFFAYAGFCFVVATTVRPLGIAASFALAAATALAVQAVVVAVPHGDRVCKSGNGAERRAMDERMRRVGENEAIFRNVNEEVRALHERFDAGAATPVVTIICECGRADCMEHLELRPDEYEAVRADGALFAVKRGHDEPGAEDVVERHDGYWVVRKHEGGPADLAREEDPRS
jgi:hypothetical protein